jgi:hypothetical protein
MTQSKKIQWSDPTGALWARFRFSVVGALLSAPHGRGELATTLHELAAKTWTHPITGHEVRFAFATIERWYYRARRAVKNERIGVVLEALEQAGQVRRTAAGWQRAI